MDKFFPKTNSNNNLNIENERLNNYMHQGLLEEFPEDINIIECKKLFEENELILKYETITKFTLKIKQAVTNLDNGVELVFPSKLPIRYKKEIAKTLLERFGDFTVVNKYHSVENNKTFEDKHTVAQSKDINDNIDKIYITFKK